MSDITFHDRTNYDEKVADTVTDYIDMARELIVLAKQKGATEDEIKIILAKLKFIVYNVKLMVIQSLVKQVIFLIPR